MKIDVTTPLLDYALRPIRQGTPGTPNPDCEACQKMEPVISGSMRIAMPCDEHDDRDVILMRDLISIAVGQSLESEIVQKDGPMGPTEKVVRSRDDLERAHRITTRVWVHDKVDLTDRDCEWIETRAAEMWPDRPLWFGRLKEVLRPDWLVPDGDTAAADAREV